MESRFGLVIVAVDSYVEMPALPSTATAQRLTDLLRPYGAEPLGPPDPATAPVVRDFLGQWSTAEDGPASTFLYWVGHGESDGVKQWLLTSGSRRQYKPADTVPAAELAENLMTRWDTRVQAEDEAWTVVVLDCCNAEVGISNILNTLTENHDREPDRIAILRVASGASTVGRFVDELAAALAATTENDDTIPLHSLLREVTHRLGEGLKPIDWLPYDAALVNPRRTQAVVTMTVDLLEDWRGLVAALPTEVRSHFVNTAQSAEVGELAWHFTGRHAEMRRVAAWLRDQLAGLLVVTGEPGAGKSALLGEVVTLADERMTAVLTEAGLLEDRTTEEMPPAGVLDVVVHLTGKTLAEVTSRVGELLPAARAGAASLVTGSAGSVRSVLDGIAALGRRVTILADALDESQEPLAIADQLLRPLAGLPNVRVLVGTRRSLLEGPDKPDPQSHELLDALGVTVAESVFLQREPAAMAEYARRRLGGRPGLAAATVDDFAGRLAGVDQPFLFVRLATNELLAREASGTGVELDRLLAGGHRDVFALAVERLAASSPVVVTLLRALAFAQGRGVPRADRVWATVAEALDPGLQVGETQIDETLRDAAAYVTLDGEAGQSVYRLAHKTFAEHFSAHHDDLALVHERIAAGLRAAVPAWPQANPYVLLHLLDHAWTDAGQMEDICTDPGFLMEVLRRFGADRLVEQLVAGRRRSPSRAVEAVAGAVRRARVALGREPHQFAGQLYSRLHAETDPALVALVDRLAEIAPPAWLRAVSAPLKWKRSVETTQDFPGQVRALAFGQVEGSTILAVGADNTLHLWDPRAGAPDARPVVIEEGVILAVGIGTRRGRPVAVVAARGGAVALRDLRSNDLLLRLDGVALTSVCLGRVSGRDVIAGGTSRTVAWWDAETGELLGDRDLGEGCLATAVAPVAGGIVVAALDWGTIEVMAVEGASTGISWSHGLGDPRVLALSEVDSQLAGVDRQVFVAAGDREGRVVCWEWLGRVADTVGIAGVGFSVRAVALARVEEAMVVAASEDADGSFGYVSLRDPQSQAEDGSLLTPWLLPALAVARSEIGLVAVCAEVPLRLRSVPDGAVVGDQPSADQVARILAGGLSKRLKFTHRGAGGTVLRSRPASNVGPRLAMQAIYRRSTPSSWPTTASTYGVVGGRPVQATGSYAGAVWIWDLKSNKLVAGPFGDVPEILPASQVYAKPGVPAVRSLSLCTAGGEDYVGSVCDGVVRVWNVGTKKPAMLPDLGQCSAVALGDMDGHLLLARGSDSGTVRLFDLTERRPLASLTMDERIEDLWLVPGERTLAVMTASYEMVLLNW